MMEKIKNSFKQHPLYVLVLAIGVITIIIVIIILMPRRNAHLAINVAPADATIVINDQQYSNGVFDNMLPGHYNVIISKPGFETKTVEIDLKSDEVVYLNEYLVQPDWNFEYYETDLESLLSLREYADSHEDAKVKAFLENYDKKSVIRDILPLEYKEELTGDYYKIADMEKNYSCSRNYCIIIESSSDIYYELALSVLRNHGYNPDDYEIVYYYDGCD